MRARTDRHRNPAAIITELAVQAKLVLRTDYEVGEAFQVGAKVYYTALFLGDPLQLTLRVIDAVGFFTKGGAPRWAYQDGPLGIPTAIWRTFNAAQRKAVVAYLYAHEGGTEMKDLLKP